MEAEGQIRHTMVYHTSRRPPVSRGGRQRSDTPPSPLSYSQERDRGADGGPAEGRGGLGRNGKNTNQPSSDESLERQKAPYPALLYLVWLPCDDTTVNFRVQVPR